ncbi:MAG TPA: ATP-binding protein [Pyrinomonadaceae bacterium]|nr:ATP-binding protein [Pyrinomonadaceae bacterium]
MKPAPNKHPEVVYRRTRDSGAPTGFAERVRGFAPALTPLIVGFLLLLGVILVLGLQSAWKMDDVASNARIATQNYSTRLSKLMELRLRFNKLENEARVRDVSETRRQLTPPFEIRLDEARDEASKALEKLGDAPPPPLTLDEQKRKEWPQRWENFKADLQSYIDLTRDVRLYSQDGFPKSRALQLELGVFLDAAQAAYDNVADEMAQYHSAANKSIRVLITIALLVGALVATGTIWQVQRHFSQMRRSVLETHRERTFTTQLLEGMVSAVAAIDDEDRIRSANAAFFRIFPNASIGASVLEKLGPDDAMTMLETVTAIRVTKNTYHGRLVARVEEEDKAFDVYSSPLAINGNRGQIVTLVDATEVAESERTLRRSESLAAVGQATTQVAHEIRNPLGSIRLGVSMLRDSVNDPDALNTIELVERGIKHLNKLVVDVTQFSRQKELERSTVDLHDSLDRSLDLITDRIIEKNTTVEKQFAPGSIVGHWDPYQLRQVFVNVIANAVDASQENSEVLISTELVAPETNGDGQPARSYARITIADQGKGMDKATRDRIFEPFFSTKKRGTGLGLAIVKQIVEQHGGRISVDSEPGKGSLFRIDLPV